MMSVPEYYNDGAITG